jgi:CRISPR-associated protein Cas2
VSRRRYLVGYDIADPKRLRGVHDVVRSFGEQLQLSVYICDLDRGERAELKWKLGDLIDRRHDSVVLIDLGEVERRKDNGFEFLGRRTKLPKSGATIV